MVKKHQFSFPDVQIEHSEKLHQGFFSIDRITLRHRLFDGGWSDSINRELFVRGEAVGVLLYDPISELVGLVEQFRIGALNDPMGPWQFEVVAGIMETGESPSDVAYRELYEEAGVEVDTLVSICSYLVSAGGTDEKMHLYCGLADLNGKSGIFGLSSENEDILLHVWHYDEVMEAKANGILNSAAVTIALQWLELNREKMQDRLC
jgi:ADP-ribose pyrophosphatase